MSDDNLFNVIDAAGFCGGIFIYSMIFALVGSSFVLFLYFWHKGRLDMDEEIKHQMMDSDD